LQKSSPVFSHNLLNIVPRLIKHAIRINEGQVVEVTLTGENRYLDILDAFTLSISQSGAYPVIRLNSPSYRRRFMKTVPDKYIGKAPPHMIKWITDIDRHINLIADAPTFVLHHVEEKRKQAHREAGRKITGQIRQKKVSTVYIPTPELANYCGIDFEQFEKLLINCLDIDYSVLRRACRTITEKIRRKNTQISLISSSDCQLNCRLQDRRVLIEDGRNTLPAGMLFFSPLEESVEGQVMISDVRIGNMCVKKLRLTFSKGKLVHSEAEQNHKAFCDRLKNSYGDSNCFAGIGVGMNPGINGNSDNGFFNFYSSQVIHVGLGSNLTYGGNNFSDLFIRMSVHQPELIVNDEVLLCVT
jgi:aminopeptidase